MDRAKDLLFSPKGIITALGTIAVAGVFAIYKTLSVVANSLVAPVITYTTGSKDEDYSPTLFAWLITLLAARQLVMSLLTKIAQQQQVQLPAHTHANQPAALSGLNGAFASGARKRAVTFIAEKPVAPSLPKSASEILLDETLAEYNATPK